MDRPNWRLGCHKLQGSFDTASGSGSWNMILHLSDWDSKKHTYNASLECPKTNTNCFNNQQLDGHQYKFHCDSQGHHCHMDLNLNLPTSFGKFRINSIYGDVRNTKMDFETDGGFFTEVPLN